MILFGYCLPINKPDELKSVELDLGTYSLPPLPEYINYINKKR